MKARHLIFYVFSSFALSLNGQVDTSGFSRPIQDIQEVSVTSNFKEIAFEDSKYYIVDFNVSELGKYLLLKNKRNYQLCRLDREMEVQSSLTLDFKPLSLFSDCLGNLHVLSKDSLYQINPYAEEISIFERNSIDLYDSFLKKCVGQIGQYVLMEELSNFGQSKVFYALDRNSHEQKLIYSIADSVAVADVNAEFSGIQANSHLEAQRMQEINIAQLGGSRRHMERVFFFIAALSKPLYNPLFVQNNTSYIFDHVNGVSLQLTDTGYVLQKKSINYQANENWAEINHHDTQRNIFYTVLNENGQSNLYELSADDYHLGKRTVITEHAYPKKIMVFDGFAYYVHKEFVDDSLNKLYRQKL